MRAMRTIRGQIVRAFEASGWTLAEFGAAITRANPKLRLGPSMLSRRLSGKTDMTLEECEAIVSALKFRMSYGRAA
jgi:hypothetical protein